MYSPMFARDALRRGRNRVLLATLAAGVFMVWTVTALDEALDWLRDEPPPEPVPVPEQKPVPVYMVMAPDGDDAT